MRYATPGAFRMALEEHLRKLAGTDSPLIQRFRKRVAFECFLARLQGTREGPWLLKGAFALELRFGDRARFTRDLDVGIDQALPGGSQVDRAQVGERLHEAAARTLSDFFQFTVSGGQPILPGDEVQAYRFSVRALLDDRLFESFVLDVGPSNPLVVPPDNVPETGVLMFAGIAPRSFRVISLPQHFAEKVHAFTRPWKDRENTRVKDLLDIILILEVSPPALGTARTAIEGAFGGRGSHPIPSRLPDPPPSWAETYTTSAATINLPVTRIDEAMGIVRTYWSKVFP